MITITKLVRTCQNYPAQWEGIGAGGEEYYFRYRWGALRVHHIENGKIGDCFLLGQFGLEFGSYLDFNGLKELLRGSMVFECNEEQGISAYS